jgi:sulfate/thiosulfate transport system permease protein
MAARKSRRVLPGFGLTLGITMTYLSLVVLIPLVGLFFRSAALSPAQFWRIITDRRVLAAFELSFGASLAAAGINCIFGFVVAWVLVRYTFPGRRILDAMVDLPFALPTAVSGIALASLYSSHGWIGRMLEPLGVKVAYTRLGVLVALTFIGIPFVVRTLQPSLAELDPELEEAAHSLGASRAQVFRRVILPLLRFPLVTGFTLAFARAVGEYGSVIFIAGNMPLRTEIAPLITIIKREQYDYAGASAVAVLMLVVSLVLLVSINFVQWHMSAEATGAD